MKLTRRQNNILHQAVSNLLLTVAVNEKAGTQYLDIKTKEVKELFAIIESQITVKGSK